MVTVTSAFGGKLVPDCFSVFLVAFKVYVQSSIQFTCNRALCFCPLVCSIWILPFLLTMTCAYWSSIIKVPFRNLAQSRSCPKDANDVTSVVRKSKGFILGK